MRVIYFLNNLHTKVSYLQDNEMWRFINQFSRVINKSIYVCTFLSLHVCMYIMQVWIYDYVDFCKALWAMLFHPCWSTKQLLYNFNAIQLLISTQLYMWKFITSIKPCSWNPKNLLLLMSAGCLSTAGTITRWILEWRVVRAEDIFYHRQEWPSPPPHGGGMHDAA